MTLQELDDKFRKELNNQQFIAVKHTDGPAVIMAGAGSGKTHTLISRVSRLICMGTIPERILMLTFTNAAADEMKDRASKQLDSRCGRIIACTYHKFCNQMLRLFGTSIGIKDYAILSYPETKNMIDYVKNSSSEFDNLKGFPTSGILADIFSMSINKQQSIAEVLIDKYPKYEKYHLEIEMLAKKVKDYCFQEGQFTYDDLLVYMNKLIENDRMCEIIAKKFDYIMVDEFQDTNNLQELMIIRLSKFNKNIVVVGDISQSIYAFRGANVKNLQNFNKKLEGCQILPLTYNYRSTQKILDLPNIVMQNNAKSWKYYDMLSARKYEKGESEDNKKRPSVVEIADSYKEVDEIMTIIHFLHDKENVPYSEISVLIRSSMQSFGLENELTNQNITFEKRGGPKFMDLDAVGDMIAFCNIVANPHNLLAWYRVLQLLPNIGKKYAKSISDQCEQINFLIENKFKTYKFFPYIEDLHQRHQKWRNHTDFMALFEEMEKYYFEMREKACEESSMKEESKEDERNAIDRDRKVVATLKTIARKYKKIEDFIDDIVLDGVQTDTADSDTLMISTIHSAKGLEWKAVIIMDCVERIFPKVPWEKWYTEEDEEELRCFYVAMTRAEDYLYIMKPRIIQTYNGTERGELSHYLKDAEDKYRYIDRTSKF